MSTARNANENMSNEFVANSWQVMRHMARIVYAEVSEQKALHIAFTKYAISWIRKNRVQFTQRDASDPSRITGERGDGYANLTRDLQTDTTFRVLASDISYMRTCEGFDYLRWIKDVKSGVSLQRSCLTR
jgi:hypothetical protein